MKLPTLESIDQSIGGRTKSSQTKTRLSFYLSHEETAILKAYVKAKDTSVSRVVRDLLKPLLKKI